MRRIFLCFFLLCGIAVSACSEHPPSIVATTAQVGDIVRNVAGDFVRVDLIMGEGVDPHLYRPNRTDRIRFQTAEIIFYSGLHLEGQMGELLDTLSREKPVIAVTENLPKASLLKLGEAYDPHVWMDAARWIEALSVVEAALIERYPDHANTFRENAAAYRTKLEALDAYAHEAIGSVPEDRRVLVTAHDAFGYFGHAYGLEVLAIQGLSTESEAGLQKIESLVSLLVERKIPVVFVETSVSERNIRALIEGAAAQGHTVKIGGELFSDAMGAPGSYEGTYIGMLDHNITTIAKALGGSPPEGGLQGHLPEKDSRP